VSASGGSKNKKLGSKIEDSKTEGFKLTALNPMNKKHIKILNKLL
jgi:hypothetical protein